MAQFGYVLFDSNGAINTGTLIGAVGTYVPPTIVPTPPSKNVEIGLGDEHYAVGLSAYDSMGTKTLDLPMSSGNQTAYLAPGTKVSLVISASKYHGFSIGYFLSSQAATVSAHGTSTNIIDFDGMYMSASGLVPDTGISTTSIATGIKVFTIVAANKTDPESTAYRTPFCMPYSGGTAQFNTIAAVANLSGATITYTLSGVWGTLNGGNWLAPIHTGVNERSVYRHGTDIVTSNTRTFHPWSISAFHASASFSSKAYTNQGTLYCDGFIGMSNSGNSSLAGLSSVQGHNISNASSHILNGEIGNTGVDNMYRGQTNYLYVWRSAGPSDGYGAASKWVGAWSASGIAP